ncbi:MAG: maleylpyruvate isomerase family mycothiol-dependent enzyme [Nocardioidaceae bacterium]|nr:maleylpyruvate isomerase family mycothiol-dependent enzyme [Nocardioidaceae bacterium]NUS52101.1 maleylpyruvate isomerase family mycothiol-dependent enzyme [Nocardioidaceae bacterium]
MADMWVTIANERGALAQNLADVSGDQWATRSLCPDWTVQDALAHMTSTAHITPPAFVLKLAGAGFNFEKFSRKGIDEWRGDSPARTLQNFRDVQQSRKHPPGPSTTWLGETIVHAEDIRRPLGIQHAYPEDAVRQVLDFYKGSNALIGTKRRIEGVTLTATDTDWTHGSGPEARGPMLSLLLAATGRKAALDDLTGDGVAVLRSRD